MSIFISFLCFTSIQSLSSTSRPPHRHSLTFPPISSLNWSLALNWMPILPQIQSGRHPLYFLLQGHFDWARLGWVLRWGGSTAAQWGKSFFLFFLFVLSLSFPRSLPLLLSLCLDFLRWGGGGVPPSNHCRQRPDPHTVIR